MGEQKTAAASQIGKRLREARLARGLSQRTLAAPGVSYAYISRVEAGNRNPSVKALRKLAQKLDVSVEWLETGEEANRWNLFTESELRLLSDALRDASGSDDILEEIEAFQRETNHSGIRRRRVAQMT